ncbi:MAG: poly-gamma-glutamate hydrolase family protein [Deltaproteobacteria bacterium]|nr:poly-gamma-glutamate hydrolase family protein [Deltaproteobacteria bacterium]
MKKYDSFQEIALNEEEGRDYQIRCREGRTDIAVVAPHGGGIEPGTTEIADGAAGEDHHFYSFEGWKEKGNSHLHITSKKFDEPTGTALIGRAETVLVVHGCKDQEKAVYVGGRDLDLLMEVERSLRDAGFPVERYNPRFPGLNPGNICNRTRSGRGVQIEISRTLRCSMFRNLARTERRITTKTFSDFVTALRMALSRRSGSLPPEP